jgi:Leucine Rich repeat
MSKSSTARWQSFSLRTLFLLVSACCLMLGGWSIYVNPYRLQSQSLTSAACLQGEVIVLPASGPPWYRWIITSILGHDAFIQVIKLDLANKPIDDAELRTLGGLCYLQKLNLDHTQITDASIPALASMQDLMSLSARYTNLSDRSAPSIAQLQGLQSLSLTGTQLTDASVDKLGKLKELKELYIRWTRISNDGAEQLKKLLPDCAIYHSALASQK